MALNYLRGRKTFDMVEWARLIDERQAAAQREGGETHRNTFGWTVFPPRMF
jgi:hypothetical protein